jgi:L-lactate dehydrogenase complex protein LldG
MSDARTAILDRIEQALRTARIPATPTDHTRAPAAQVPSADPAALVERFAAEARVVGVEVFVDADAAAVRERLASFTAGRRILSWNPDQLPYDAAAVLAGALLGDAPREAQAAADVGITSCHGAIAETGSLALLSIPGCSRAVSLLPPVHVALVHPRQLFFGMAEFFAARAGEIARASNLTFVTGPSRTADIELSLTIGVHGPGRVVILVGPE